MVVTACAFAIKAIRAPVLKLYNVTVSLIISLVYRMREFTRFMLAE